MGEGRPHLDRGHLRVRRKRARDHAQTSVASHRPHMTRIPVSYLISFWKRVDLSLLRNPLSHLPQSRKREQRWFCGAMISLRRSCVVSQAGCDGPVVAVGHANDQVRIWPTAHPNELDTLAMQGMMGMGHRDPFHRWFVKGGSVR